MRVRIYFSAMWIVAPCSVSDCITFAGLVCMASIFDSRSFWITIVHRMVVIY